MRSLDNTMLVTWPRRGLKPLMKATLVALLLVSLAAVLVFRAPLPGLHLWDTKEAKLNRDSRMFFEWEGFGPEKGLYNFTVVTALVDIGRGQWNFQSRGFNEYLLYMQRVLKLDVNMVVYIHDRGAPTVRWMRRGREHRTRIIATNLEDLPYYKYKSQIQSVMDSEDYKRDNELVRKRLCEATIPDYDIVQWSKLYFLHRAIQSDPFRNNYFIWIDAGYGRGEDIHPADGVWKPLKLFSHMDQVTFLEREDVETYRPLVERLHKMSINIIPGGFVGGGAPALERLYTLQQQHVVDWLHNGVVDDDQTMWMQLYFKHPALFNLVRADWYDAFKIFNEDPLHIP
ncbi:protein HtrL-like isoform X3 [Littorina saxatilis]|uniref:Uncharacterized protein n=2 Tax=Littorina saxatilis TaxID=31220 RepID=A0AAN9FVJ6_9CAEN